MQDDGPVDRTLRVETRLAVLGRGGHLPGQPLNVPIVPASNFRAAPNGTGGREYSRDDGTPGWEAFEELLGNLEGGLAVSFSSGMAATSAVLELAARQMRGFGAVLSLEVSDPGTADAVCAHVRVITAATSLGGVESTIERRAKLPGQDHVPAGLLRLSVGCEHVEDLWADLAAALETSAAAPSTESTVRPHVPARSHP